MYVAYQTYTQAIIASLFLTLLQQHLNFIEN